MKKNERLDALQILSSLLEKKIPLSHLLKPELLLSPLTKEICFGVCRHYFRLEQIANQLLSKRPKQIEIWIVVLMGLYQLHFMQKPDYAVVKETVALVDKIKKPWAKSLVNAVLRTYCRTKEDIISSLKNNKEFIYGHPTWFVERLKTHWPNDWEYILKANDVHPPMSLRVNCRQIQRDQYLKRLDEAGIKAYPHSDAMEGIRLETPCSVYDLPGFMEGDVSVQDEAAQLAVSLLALKPQLNVLDACCAPGGKTAHILETESQLASCLALDIDEKRLMRVKENILRLNLAVNLVKADALEAQPWWNGQQFDRILLDAPCSATGVIRRHPDIKILRTEQEISTVVQLQAKLLQALWPLLAPNGLLVYATCSILPEENEQQIARFVKDHEDCLSVIEKKPWGRMTGHGLQILPGENYKDGFFYSVLKRIK